MKKFLEQKLKSHHGSNHIIVILGLVAIVLLLMIAIPVVKNNTDNKMNNVDEEQIVYAEHQASIEYQKNYKPFTAVFDTETKQFVDKRTARMSVKPYGSSKEHQGMYLLITVDKDGNISSQWISP
jgi:ABC-type bacteriocin/lantibiotic exporter with double-glycine peptidase domain